MALPSTHENSFLDSFVPVGLVAAALVLIPFALVQPQTSAEFSSMFVSMFRMAIPVGLLLGYFSRWWRLSCAAGFEDLVALLFHRTTLLVVALGVVGVFALTQASNIIPSGTDLPLGTTLLVLLMIAVLLGLAVLALPFMLVVLAFTLVGAVVLFVLSWISPSLGIWAFLPGLVPVAVGGLVGAIGYTMIEYLRIFFSRQPLQDVLAQYAELTSEQLRARIELAVRQAGDFNTGSVWELEKQTRISKELAAKLRADRTLIEEVIAHARAENAKRLERSS